MKRIFPFLLGILLIAGCNKPYLNVDPTNLTFAFKGGERDVTVSANNAWTATVSGDGITVSPMSGAGDATVTVSVPMVGASGTVSGTITFQSEGLTVTVNVKQDKESDLAIIKRVLNDFENATGYRPEQEYKSGELRLWIWKTDALKGEIPESFGDLGEMLVEVIFDAAGLVGTLPDSFRKMTKLRKLIIRYTGMTSLPDVFGDMKELNDVHIIDNEEMTGSLPESLGSSPALESLVVYGNSFTGDLPASWGKLGRKLDIGENCLSGVVPDSFLAANDSEWLMMNVLWQKEGFGFDLSSLDFHGWQWWPKDQIQDIDGNSFSFDDVIKKNKYTVYIFWADWCPFSKELMPQLRDYYNKYHDDGLEVIATIALDSISRWKDLERQRQEVMTKGYDKWYNYYFPLLGETDFYPSKTPTAEVYDSNGMIVFSSQYKYPDPFRDRFGKTASTDLIPFLETLFGPAEEPDPYISTDYSMDGKYLTLQQASVGKGINLVFMGDAYVDREMTWTYETVLKDAVEEFFSIEPYKSFRDRFNVYIVYAVSPKGQIGNGNVTALSTAFGGGTYVQCDDEKCFDYALGIPGITGRENLTVCVLANTKRSCGTTSLYESLQSGIAVCSSIGNNRELFGSTVRHEMGGHGFAFLADEYSQSSSAAPADHIAYYNRLYDSYGWFANVDFTKDPAKIRWSAFLSDNRYKDDVGIFEGGALYSKGTYRPTSNSIMNMNMGDYNAPSRWAIYQRIMKLSGETPTFEAFLQYDEVNRRSGGGIRPPLKAVANRHIERGAPPVIVR